MPTPTVNLPRAVITNFADRRFAPYTTAIGQAALTWNYLHEVLCALFADMLADTPANPHAIWFSANFDRARREMLKAAILDKSYTYTGIDSRDRFAEPIKWLLAETSKLEDARNDIIHAPLVFLDAKYVNFLADKLGVVPHKIYGNTRAVNLSKKADLLAHIRWCRDTASVLTEFALEVVRAVRTSSPELPAPLPKKPQMPNRGQKKAAQSRSRQPRPK